VTNAWLHQYVVPNILCSDNIQEAVAMVLALPLLWAAFDDEMEAYMPGADGIDGHWEHMTDRFEGQQDRSAFKNASIYKSTRVH
jgi:hypothetical protein